jgi:hypothetical protein
VLRPARYLDDVEKVEFGELHVFIGPEFVVTVRHAESPDLAQVRRRLEQTPELLRLGPEAVFYAILDQVVDEYGSLGGGAAGGHRGGGADGERPAAPDLAVRPHVRNRVLDRPPRSRHGRRGRA